MKRLIPLALLLSALLLCAPAFAQDAPDEAVAYQINATHTGATQTPHLTPPLRPRWSVNLGQSISYPVIAGGKVFVTVRNGSGEGYGTKLYALNASDGSIAWGPVALGGSYWWSGLCYENGRLFALNSDGLWRAFDAASGSVLWTKQMYGTTSPPTAHNGLVYSAYNGWLYALSAETGALVWKSSVANGDWSSPAVTDDGVYVAYACLNVYRFQPQTGAQLWRYSEGCSGGGGKTPVFYNGRLYARDYSPHRVFDAATGDLLGTFVSRTAPAFSGNKGFFLNASMSIDAYGTLEAFNLDTNTLAWRFAGDGMLRSAPLVVNDHVYVGSRSGLLYALDVETGAVAWSANLGASIPYVDEHNVSQPLTGFAAAGGLLVIPTNSLLVAYEGDAVAPTLEWGAPTPAPNAEGWNNTPVEIPYTANDDFSGVKLAAPGSPVRFDSEGANQTQTVAVIDNADNTAEFTSPAVNIDLSAPVSVHTLSGVQQGAEDWYMGAVQFTLDAGDNVSGVKAIRYALDGGAEQTYNGPFSVSADGAHTLVYWAEDRAGNTSQQRTVSFRLDGTAPVTVAQVSAPTGNDGWHRGPAQVTLNTTDSASGVEHTGYMIDNGPAQVYSGPFNVSGDGNHTVTFWSFDRARNRETEKTVSFRVDANAPLLFQDVSGPLAGNGWYRGPVQLTLDAGDHVSGVETIMYQYDGGPAQAYSGPFNVSGDGPHSVIYWATDRAGNSTPWTAISFNIDATAPVTNASAGGPGDGTWFRGQAQVTLSASDQRTGVAATHYALDGGPWQPYMYPFFVSGDGAHTVSFYSVDYTGNGEQPRLLAVNVDGSAPSVTVSATPSSMKATKKPANFTVSGRVTDLLSGYAAGSANFNVVDEYGQVQPAGAVTVRADGTYSFTVQLTASRNNNDTDGRTYTVHVRASDKAGNQGSASFVIRIT